MDNYGFVSLVQNVGMSALTIQRVRKEEPPHWTWASTPIFYPESKCPWCQQVIRSEGIWFLSGDKFDKLDGVLFPNAAGVYQFIQPSHPHDTGGGFLCIGSNRDGIALLASPYNNNDTPLGKGRSLLWLKRYWNKHCCPQMLRYAEINWTSILQELESI